MQKELCTDTFNIAAMRFPLKDAALHSDRGSYYTSEAFRKALSYSQVTQSLNGVDHWFDNATMESFFATLKKELFYRISIYKMQMDDVRAIIFRYIFIYFNQVRIYTSNPNGLPPAVYRRIMEKDQLLAAW